MMNSENDVRMAEMLEEIKDAEVRYKRALIRVSALEIESRDLIKKLGTAKKIESLAENDLYELKAEYFSRFGKKYDG